MKESAEISGFKKLADNREGGEMKGGGQAFPVQDMRGDEHGMTLRDWFAGRAISGQAESVRFGNKSDAKMAAITAYIIADAMLAEREKEKL